MNAPMKPSAVETPGVVNGIDVDDIVELAAEVARDKALGKARWRVASTWQGQTHSRAQVESFHLGDAEVPRRFTIDMDEPRQLGGADAFANPQEHLLAALNACMMVGYVALAARQGIALESLEIETEGEIDLAGFFALNETVPPGYGSLAYTVRIKGDGTDAQFAAIHEQVMATSPNFHNVARPVTLKPTLVVEH